MYINRYLNGWMLSVSKSQHLLIALFWENTFYHLGNGRESEEILIFCYYYCQNHWPLVTYLRKLRTDPSWERRRTTIFTVISYGLYEGMCPLFTLGKQTQNFNALTATVGLHFVLRIVSLFFAAPFLKRSQITDLIRGESTCQTLKNPWFFPILYLCSCKSKMFRPSEDPLLFPPSPHPQLKTGHMFMPCKSWLCLQLWDIGEVA